MKAGFDPNTVYMGTPVLIFAIYTNKPECAEILLNAGADPETSVPPLFVSPKSINALSYAIDKKSSKIVECLIKNGVDVNKEWNGNIPLNRAIEKKQTKIVEMLLQAGAIPNQKTWKLVNKSKDEYLKFLFANIKENNENNN